MNESNSHKLSMLILGICLIVSAALISRGYVESKSVDLNNFAAFTGKASRAVESDQAKWSIVLTRSASTTEEATKLIEQDHEALRKLVSDAKVSDAKYSFHPITSQNYVDYGNDDYYGRSGPSSYQNMIRASQIVVIESGEVADLGALAEHAPSKLSSSGSQLQTDRIEFMYSKLNELEKELDLEALKTARKTAEELLGNQLGNMRSMEQPLLSVQPENSVDYYYSKDTSSIKKNFSVVVKMTFRIK
ncbi:MAG: SIMPL domain-containing protein [Candidatus Uhrbacteria bacterium]